MDPLSMQRATTKISKHCPRAYRYKWGLENSYSNEITPEITPVKPICLKSIYRGHITPGGRPCRAFRLRSYERSNRQLVNHLSLKRGQTDCWSSLEIIPTPMAKQKGNTFFFGGRDGRMLRLTIRTTILAKDPWDWYIYICLYRDMYIYITYIHIWYIYIYMHVNIYI